ncbi:hypothetical protein GCM10010103_06030 [Streptomyces paradoxus]
MTVRAARRPCRSATAPISSPPTGRMKKPTANTANVDSSGTSELSALWGKTWSAMQVARNV